MSFIINPYRFSVGFEVTHVVDTGLQTVTAANPITASSVNLGSFGGTKHVILRYIVMQNLGRLLALQSLVKQVRLL